VDVDSPGRQSRSAARHDQGVPETLVIAFAMVVLNKLCDRASEVALTHQLVDHA
jgi:hypothetical protein